VSFAAFCIWLAIRIFNRRERWAKWMLAAAVVGVPALYVFSSGPTRTVAFHKSSITATNPGVTFFMADEWWLNLYEPLIWVSQQSWGTPLNWYWERFPLPIPPSPSATSEVLNRLTGEEHTPAPDAPQPAPLDTEN